ncbi:hypothetical protein [Xanthobacter agilis]|uniref:Flagellar basal body-associated protein FliL n=1 Tax=Xanthobacter agilis TaxID=47492 RepID=A0ABU0LHS5_XANAG|nr:hypothetical protein [Xanthobacter agilis]MDQ0506692.1 hypothetical protein [Xanthobacter agilis]
MIRFIIIGVWVCVVALASTYAAAYWVTGSEHGKAEDSYLSGLEYRRLPVITVPMVIDGSVKGYVLVKLVFTADASLLRKMPIDPGIFAVNAAFQEIYVNGRVEGGKMAKYNLPEMLERIRQATNAHLNGDVVREVLVDSLNYVDKTDLRSGPLPAPNSAEGERQRK